MVKNLICCFQYGLVSYSTDAEMHFKIGDYINAGEMVHAINTIPHKNMSTYTNLGLSMAASDCFQNSRPGMYIWNVDFRYDSTFNIACL